MEATEKQIKYAKAIAERLGLKLPDANDKVAYGSFISQHVEAYKSRPPTSKQVEFASRIAKALGINLPGESTRQTLFLFIRDNKPRFLEKQSVARHNARVASVAYASDAPDDDPSQPDDPDGDVCMMESMGLDPYTGGFEDNY